MIQGITPLPKNLRIYLKFKKKTLRLWLVVDWVNRIPNPLGVILRERKCLNGLVLVSQTLAKRNKCLNLSNQSASCRHLCPHLSISFKPPQQFRTQEVCPSIWVSVWKSKRLCFLKQCPTRNQQAALTKRHSQNLKSLHAISTNKINSIRNNNSHRKQKTTSLF